MGVETLEDDGLDCREGERVKTAPPDGACQPDFTRPLKLLMDCHRRIEHFLGVFRKVVEGFGGGDLNDENQRALETSLNYLRQAASRHTADEEQSLFPRLRRSDSLAAREVMAELDRLEADHRRVESVHKSIDELGRRWLERGRLNKSDGTRLRALLDDLAMAYVGHIRLEDERVFVLASQVLKAGELREVGEEMEERRVEDPGRAGSRCARRRQRLRLVRGKN